MISDFHLHTEFSSDSETPVRSQIEQAISLGMTELCITDHHDYDARSKDMTFILDTDSYLPYLRQIQEEYQDRIRINIGVELGLQTHIKDYLEHYITQYPFDFIIGSSHFIDGLDPYYPDFFEGRTGDEAYGRYFEVTLQRLRTLDCFDSFGHLDYPARYGPAYSFQTHQDYIDAILKTLIQKGRALECNTGGYKYGMRQPNPHEQILTRYRELGGELLTIGSDAHTPEYLGYRFDHLGNVLKSCGFRYYCVYRSRIPQFIAL
ncbi:MAG: histidinol-phosphatase HisJ family protein [Lachnospiraceae bacterium]